MPFVVRSDSENEAELVFLSPKEESVQVRKAQADQGASPVLRRSNRKRKSTTTYPTGMSKGSGSKKKKAGTSPDPCKSMPKIPRTPQAGAGQDEPKETPNGGTAANRAPPPSQAQPP